MKLSELNAFLEEQSSQGTEIRKIYGVEVDAYVAKIPAQLDEIGFVAKANEDEDDLDDDLIDVLSHYYKSTKGTLKIILEIPFDFELDAKSVIHNMHLLKFDTALMLPKDERIKSEDAWMKFADQNIEYLNGLFDLTMVSKQVLPLNSYVQYLQMIENGYAPETITNDEYINSRYVEGVDIELMDKMKDKLRVAIYDKFGGEAEFRVYSHSLNAALRQHIINKMDAAQKGE
ncbi:hypothetical protein LMH73_019315 [Vibrio splendidus]|nr:hypothetical protein [Vibrio splendidus]MCC4883233.1 hypothetical protein [Vibrio splendidus]